MGNQNSQELNNAVIQITNETCNSFRDEFIAVYRDIVITNTRSKSTANNSFKLLKASLPHHMIKYGNLMKIGKNVKSWKNRYFFVMNENYNYLVLYSSDELCMNIKGKFFCNGYSVQAFSNDEVSIHGILGLKLVPFDKTKRVWYLRADTLENYYEWFEVFTIACFNTKVLHNIVDTYVSMSFNIAYHNVRAKYGYFGSYPLKSIENSLGLLEYEKLLKLVMAILNPDIIETYTNKYSSKKSSEAAKLVVRNRISDIVFNIVKPIIISTWKLAYSYVDEMKSQYIESIGKSIKLYIDAEDALISNYKDHINSIVNPVLQDVNRIILKPFLNYDRIDLIIKSYEYAIFGMYRGLNDCIDNILCKNTLDVSVLNDEMNVVYNLIEECYHGDIVINANISSNSTRNGATTSQNSTNEVVSYVRPLHESRKTLMNKLINSCRTLSSPSVLASLSASAKNKSDSLETTELSQNSSFDSLKKSNWQSRSAPQLDLSTLSSDNFCNLELSTEFMNDIQQLARNTTSSFHKQLIQDLKITQITTTSQYIPPSMIRVQPSSISVNYTAISNVNSIDDNFIKQLQSYIKSQILFRRDHSDVFYPSLSSTTKATNNISLYNRTSRSFTNIRETAETILKDVISSLGHDAVLSMYRCIKRILEQSIECYIQELMLIPCNELQYSAASTVPLNLVDSINISRTFERYIREVLISQYLNEVLKETYQWILIRIDAYVANLTSDSMTMSRIL